MASYNNMDDEETIQNNLVDILTRFDEDVTNAVESNGNNNGDNESREFEYICNIIHANKSSKILRLAVQTLEKCCTKNINLIKSGGFQALINLFNISNERAIKIVCAQAISRITRLFVESDDEDGSAKRNTINTISYNTELMVTINHLLQANQNDNVICRSLKESLDTLQKYIEGLEADGGDVGEQMQGDEGQHGQHNGDDDNNNDQQQQIDEDDNHNDENNDRNYHDDNEYQNRHRNDEDGDEHTRHHTESTTSNRRAYPQRDDQSNPQSSSGLFNPDQNQTINLGMITDPNTIHIEDLLLSLAPKIKIGIKILFRELNEMRLKELNGRLTDFWKPNFTTPTLIERHMRLTSQQVTEFMIVSGFYCKPDHYINEENFVKLQNTLKMMTSNDFYDTTIRTLNFPAAPVYVGGTGGYDRDTAEVVRRRGTDYDDNDYVDRNRGGGGSYSSSSTSAASYRDSSNSSSYRTSSAPYSSSSSSAKSYSSSNNNAAPASTKPAVVTIGLTHRAPDGTIREHDNATPFLLIRNLPLDVTATELLVLLRKTSGCGYLEAKDVIIPAQGGHNVKDKEKAETIGAHAYVNFQHIKDARNTRNELDGKPFGQRPLEIEYSLGRPNRSVWIGAVPPELTQEQIERFMKRYGPLQRIDLKRRRIAGDAFAFAIYDRLEDAIEAVKSMAERGNMIDGSKVRIGFSSSSLDQNLSSSTTSGSAPTSGGRDRQDRDIGGRDDRDNRDNRDNGRNRDSYGRGDSRKRSNEVMSRHTTSAEYDDRVGYERRSVATDDRNVRRAYAPQPGDNVETDYQRGGRESRSVVAPAGRVEYREPEYNRRAVVTSRDYDDEDQPVRYASHLQQQSSVIRGSRDSHAQYRQQSTHQYATDDGTWRDSHPHDGDASVNSANEVDVEDISTDGATAGANTGADYDDEDEEDGDDEKSLNILPLVGASPPTSGAPVSVYTTSRKREYNRGDDIEEDVDVGAAVTAPYDAPQQRRPSRFSAAAPVTSQSSLPPPSSTQQSRGGYSQAPSQAKRRHVDDRVDGHQDDAYYPPQRAPSGTSTTRYAAPPASSTYDREDVVYYEERGRVPVGSSTSGRGEVVRGRGSGVVSNIQCDNEPPQQAYRLQQPRQSQLQNASVAASRRYVNDLNAGVEDDDQYPPQTGYRGGSTSGMRVPISSKPQPPVVYADDREYNDRYTSATNGGRGASSRDISSVGGRGGRGGSGRGGYSQPQQYATNTTIAGSDRRYAAVDTSYDHKPQYKLHHQSQQQPPSNQNNYYS